MPTYEYACRECDEEMEIFQSIRDPHLTTCPACKKEGLRRLIGRGAGIIFKGSGFYETDYKKPSSKSEGGDKKGGAAPAASTDSSSSSAPSTPPPSSPASPKT